MQDIVHFPDGATAVLASWRDRFLARCTDTWLLVGALAPVLFFVILYSWAIDIWHSPGREPRDIRTQLEEAVLLWMLPIAVATIVSSIEGVILAKSGATRGMRRRGIQVVQLSNGQPVILADALLRTITPISAAVAGLAIAYLIGLPDWSFWFGFLAWCIVYCSSIWHPLRRGWHDLLAGTIVVSAQFQ